MLDGLPGFYRKKIATDSFSYSDGNLGTVSGGLWVQNFGWYGNITISSGIVADGNEFSGCAFYTNGVFEPDQYSQCVITSSNFGYSGQYAGVAARIGPNLDNSSDNTRSAYIFLAVDDDQDNLLFRLAKVVDGVVTYIANDWVGIEWTAPMTIAIECIGTTIRGLVNGEIRCVATDSSLLSGRPGITGTSSGGGAIPRDDWEGGNILRNPHYTTTGELDSINIERIDCGTNFYAAIQAAQTKTQALTLLPIKHSAIISLPVSYSSGTPDISSASLSIDGPGQRIPGTHHYFWPRISESNQILTFTNSGTVGDYCIWVYSITGIDLTRPFGKISTSVDTPITVDMEREGNALLSWNSVWNPSAVLFGADGGGVWRGPFAGGSYYGATVFLNNRGAKGSCAFYSGSTNDWQIVELRAAEKQRKSRIITRQRVWTEQPPYDCEIDFSNPIVRGLLVAATPFSKNDGFNGTEERSVSRAGQVIRGGMLLRRTTITDRPYTFGVLNSSFVVVDAMLGADGDGFWWQAGKFAYRDTASDYPYDNNTFGIMSCTGYGSMRLTVRGDDGTRRFPSVDVVPRGPDGDGWLDAASGAILIRGGTIDSTGVLAGWGEDGMMHGTDSTLVGQPLASPANDLLQPCFGISVAGDQPDTVSYQALVLRWGRKLNDGEMRSIMLNPWQVFKPRNLVIFTGSPVIEHKRRRIL